MTQQYQSRAPSNSLLRKLFQCQGVLALHVADLADAQRRAILDLVGPHHRRQEGHPSHFVFAGWKPSTDRTDMVYGLEDEIYLVLYTAWRDPADDQRYCDWAQLNMAAMSHLATSISLADENLARRPAKFITDPNMTRLDKVRAAHDDPDGLFHSWMARE